MKKMRVFAIVLIIAVSFAGCNSQKKITSENLKIDLVPQVSDLTKKSGTFSFDEKIVVVSENEELLDLQDYLSKFLFEECNKNVAIVSKKPDGLPFIHLFLKKNAQLGNEGYTLEISDKYIELSAHEPAGIFYGIQTLKQLVATNNHAKIILPQLLITDIPKFPWRGMLLDCCRHFMEKEFVKRYIDLLAYHKMNRLHWHLTEDQGWRIEIEKYPKLTEIGAWRNEVDGKKYGGFYSKEDVKEIVEYAASRYITVVPEIELPGHSSAALASYPEISCTGGPFQVETNWGVFKDIYCAGNDNTFAFLQDVLDEVCELFPSEYIHIGGDEAPKYRWENCEKCQKRIEDEKLHNEHELQSYFIKRIEKYLSSKGKKIIGWDEILEGGLAPGATVQSWRGIEGGIEAARTGHDAIMSPTSHAYFDYDVKTTDLEKVYSFDPIPEELNETEAKHILGGECNMWTERAPQETIDNKVFPRILAMAEVLWTYPQNRNYEEFHNRVQTHYDRLEKLGVNYGFESQPVIFKTEIDLNTGNYKLILSSGKQKLDIHFTIDGSEPNENSEKYSQAILIDKTCKIKAIALHDGKRIGNIFERKFTKHKAIGKKIILKNQYSKNYPANGENSIIDGLKGTNEYRDKLWQGFEGEDLEAIIDLNETMKISEIKLGFLQSVPSWIFAPTKVSFYTSSNGKDYEKAEEITDILPEKLMKTTTKDIGIKLDNTKAQFIKIVGLNKQKCPDWHPGAGGKTWIFIDEIEIY